MSKLPTVLRTLGRPAGGAIGFAPAGDRRSAQQLIVAADVASGDAAAAAVEAGASMVVAPDAASVAAVAEAAGDAVVAVRIAAATAGDVTTAREAGADLFLFDDAESEAAALLDREIGGALLLGDDRSEERLRTIASLPAEAIVITPPATLTVRDQLAMRRVAELTQKPLIAVTDSAPDATTLEVWRDAGAPVVLLTSGDAAAIGALRQAADAVPAPRQRSDERPTALVPLFDVDVDDVDDEELD